MSYPTLSLYLPSNPLPHLLPPLPVTTFSISPREENISILCARAVILSGLVIKLHLACFPLCYRGKAEKKGGAVCERVMYWTWGVGRGGDRKRGGGLYDQLCELVCVVRDPGKTMKLERYFKPGEKIAFDIGSVGSQIKGLLLGNTASKRETSEAFRC